MPARPPAVEEVMSDGVALPGRRPWRHRTAEQLDEVFDPFFATKPPGQGTGLSLDIARRLVRQHGGEVEVSSRPGRTEFRVRLPVAAGVALPPGPMPTAAGLPQEP